MDLIAAFGLPILQITWIDLLLSGDNAVVIALACRSLPPEKRRLGIILGAGAAVTLRIAFTAPISLILGIPYIHAIGGVLLIWIAIKLLSPEEDSETNVHAHPSVWRAVYTVAIADAVMSLDNIVAIAAVARGNVYLIVFGLLLSIPLVVGGSSLITSLLKRLPILVWAGAALLGWVAGEMIAADERVMPLIGAHLELFVMVTSVLVVLTAGWLTRAGAQVRP